MRISSYIPPLLAAAIGLACSSAQVQTEIPASQVPPVVDTLRDTFEELQQAMLLGQEERFFSLIDPRQADTLQKLVRKHGYLSLKTYLERKFAYWPNLDTLDLYEVKRSGAYIRLTYAGPGTAFGYREPRVRYTFLLFRSVEGAWKMSAATGLECRRYDPYGYGYAVSVHETDLPPKLRFPKAF